MEQPFPLNAMRSSLDLLASQGESENPAFVRVVRLSFCPEHVVQFMDLFEEFKARIAGHPGCRFVYLLRCGETFFTISGWNRPEDLETYRTSSLFGAVWKKTRSWLSEPAQAWSCPIASWVESANHPSSTKQI